MTVPKSGLTFANMIEYNRLSHFPAFKGLHFRNIYLCLSILALVPNRADGFFAKLRKCVCVCVYVNMRVRFQFDGGRFFIFSKVIIIGRAGRQSCIAII